MSTVQKIPYSKVVSNFVCENERSGVGRVANFKALQTKDYQHIPRSIQTFYNLYKDDLDAVHADTVSKVGGKVVDQALQGDFKSQEFYLRSKGGWSPQSTEVQVEEKETDESALDRLMQKINPIDNSDEEET